MESTVVGDALWLFPNFGAEEESGQPVAMLSPEVAVRWRNLFGGRSCWARLRRPYPFENEGPPPDRPAFTWLENCTGLVAWYCNEKANQVAEKYGVSVWGPPADVVRSVHDKAFAVRFTQQSAHCPLDQLATVIEPEICADSPRAEQVVGDTLSSWPAEYEQFTLKPRLGCNARGRIPGWRNSGRRAMEQVLRGLRNMLSGAVLEPFVPRLADLSIQFFVSPEGQVEELGVLLQRTNVAGACFGHEGQMTASGRFRSTTEYDDAIRMAAYPLVEEAAAKGYWGPCGIDAFVYLDPVTSKPTLRPIVEFNARFTMGIIYIGSNKR